ncbi:protein of unknown function [Nitrospina watsonii]|uniref:Uncharacterized protein n=1 Tax=Nitrospina watsonii TaxID=1323948 RepID=A0ABM9HA25_9BACT|nr:protein of unknown function [Nitrospina watsonii]
MLLQALKKAANTINNPKFHRDKVFIDAPSSD